MAAGEVHIHGAIVTLHDSPGLTSFFREVLNELGLAPTYADPAVHDLPVAVQEHDALLDTFKIGLPPLAAEALSAHLNAGEVSILQAVHDRTAAAGRGNHDQEGVSE